MTREEFYTFWLQGMGLSMQEAEQLGYQAVPCDCGETSCQGWRMELDTDYQKVKERLAHEKRRREAHDQAGTH